MENSKKLIIILFSSSILAPLVILLMSLWIGFFDIRLGIFIFMMFTLLPVAALGAYMWITGKGQWAISGYNTMGKSQQAYYDAERMAKDVGKVCVIIGLACLMGSFALMYMQGGLMIFVAIVTIVCVASVAYVGTGRRYLKDQARTPPPQSKEDRKVIWAFVGVSLFQTAVICIIVLFFIGSGSVHATLDDEGLRIDGPSANRNLSYEDMVSIELREDLNLGGRVGGFGGTKVLGGNFNNEEFGDYTLACYKAVRTYIVIEPEEGKMLVFNLDGVEETVDFYNELLEKWDKD